MQEVLTAPRVGPPGPPAKHPTVIVVVSVLGSIALCTFLLACCGLVRTRRRRKARQQRPGIISDFKPFEAQPAVPGASEAVNGEASVATAATAAPASPASAHGSTGEFLTPRAGDAGADTNGAAAAAAADGAAGASTGAGVTYVEPS